MAFQGVGLQQLNFFKRRLLFSCSLHPIEVSEVTKTYELVMCVQAIKQDHEVVMGAGSRFRMGQGQLLRSIGI